MIHCVPYTVVQERDVALQSAGLTWMRVAEQQSCISLAAPLPPPVRVPGVYAEALCAGAVPDTFPPSRG